MPMSEMGEIYDWCEVRIWERLGWEYKNKEDNIY